MTDQLLVGTWRLEAYEVLGADGESSFPFGAEPTGFLTYTADGYMSGQLGRAVRTPIAGDDWETATNEAIAEAARHYFAYCGTFHVSGDKVTHRVELSLLPNWIGGEQTRIVSLRGDTLTLSSSFIGVDGRLQTAVLRWIRLGAATA